MLDNNTLQLLILAVLLAAVYCYMERTIDKENFTFNRPRLGNEFHEVLHNRPAPKKSSWA